MRHPSAEPHSPAGQRRVPAHRAAAGAAGVLAACCAVLLGLVVTRWGPLLALDAGIARSAHRGAVRDEGLTAVCRVLSDRVLDPLTLRLLCAGVALWLVWRRGAGWTALWLLSGCALAALVQQAVKAAVGRPRPSWADPVDSAHYAAFPSGHAMTATVVCGLLLWLLYRHGIRGAGWWAAVAAALLAVTAVGASRVWLGVHWASDVLGGWLFGALVTALAVTVYAWPRGTRRRRARRT